MAAPADPRCDCGQENHLQVCRIESERRQLADALLRAALERAEERSRGFRQFDGAGQALRWFYSRRRRWSSPRAPSLEPATAGGRGESPARRVFAAVACAIKAAETDARERGEELPVVALLEQHYLRGRNSAFVAEELRVPQANVGRVLARARRVIRARLCDGGWIED